MKYKELIFILFISCQVYPQQVPFFKQYMVNRFSLSPAFAGFNQNYEIFATYQNDMAGIDNSPKSSIISFKYHF